MTCETSRSRSSSICVIFNPAAGRSRARQRLEAILTGWLSKAEFWPTERRGHAEELARRAAGSGFRIVAAAGGNGTVHEVANGVLKAGRPEVRFAVIPLGSADDYAHSLTGTIDGEPISANPTLLISLLLGRREGGFVMAPDARLDDGWFDCVHAGNLTRWEALRLIPAISAAGPPRDHPKVHLRRCRRVVVESAQDLIIHTDGEILCRPENRVRRVEVELLPGSVLVRCGLEGITS